MNETEQLAEAIDPFRRALALIDAMPDGHKIPESSALRDTLPGIWPTLADLRKLVEAAKEE